MSQFENLHRVGVTVDRKKWQALQRILKKEGRSMSSWVREKVARALPKMAGKQ